MLNISFQRNRITFLKPAKIIAKTIVKPIALALILAFFSYSASAASTVIDDMNVLVAQGRYQEAYLLGQSELFDFEGEPEFDFLYGMAALEVGRPDEAVFAFERIAFNYADQQRIKLELARAYYLSNNFTAADLLFREVLATDPEPNVATNIENFLELIDQQLNTFESSINWYLTSSVGTDTNINSATELGIIDTPIGDIELNPGGRSVDDDYMDIGGGLTYTLPLDKNSAISVSGSATQHNNFSSNQFDLDILSADAAYVVGFNNYRVNSTVRAQKVNLDSEAFQNSSSLMSTVQRFGNNGWSQSLTGAYTAVRYDTSANVNNNLRDVNQLLLSSTLGKSSAKFVHNLTVYYGDDKILRDQGKNNATQFYGIAFSEQFLLMPGHVPYFRMSLHKSDNQARDPIFNVKRDDETFSASLGWIWQANQRLNVTADVTYTDTDSNLDLYAYDRVKLQAVLRYQF